MHCIVGLGNPGEEYEGTRHNIGRDVVRALAEEWQCSWKLEKRLSVEIAQYRSPEVELPAGSSTSTLIILALPTTYMNDSGRAVKKLTSNFKLLTSNVLIVHDDLDLPLGTIRVSQNASAAGHKGVQSIIDALKTQTFVRLRIGIRPSRPRRVPTDAFVLQPFSRGERALLPEIKKRATEALNVILRDGLAQAMNQFNRM